MFLSAEGGTIRMQPGMPPRRFVVIGFYILILLSLLICVYVIRASPQFNQYRLVRSWQGDYEETVRTVLLWNSFFGHRRWSLSDDSLGPNAFQETLKCPVYQCELTNQRDFLPSVEMYDAVVFHTAEPFALVNSIPAKRSAKQLYVFALMEPPGETKHVLSDEGDFYNLTMTYRLDSDVVWTYQVVEDIATGAVVAPAENPKWLTPPFEFNDTELWKSVNGKTRMAAWFVSHCTTLSEREKLAREIQKFTDVHIYGKCGNFSCAYKARECDELLDNHYKFYFAFENSLCQDYVTEKLYNALKRNIIPVVFGGADYSKFLPPRSYINVEDFNSVRDLTNYMDFLATHPKEYTRYFWWRQHYRLGEASPFCGLCQKLHQFRYNEKVQSYRNIESWWLNGRCRFKSKIKFNL